MAVQLTSIDQGPELAPDRRVLWYQDAVIYQLHVRSFCDSNGDGVGDLAGLTTKLDYIQSLGVSAIWLLPFFPSPLKDDGYDIADYTSINPVYGSMHDFRLLLREAHRRDLRVITELVMNHTSDQHPWFQRSRRAPAGSPWRGFYVWSDTSDRYRDARVIFQDFEGSNWTWDPLARAYYWHRFYSHQPDLNFDNPQVRAAMLEAIDFWLGMGVDGIRLDAVPYLFEREGTDCENLPETHAFLKSLRRHVDEHFEDRMLLAEANQWPEDAAEYFGNDDECHMNFHFPLMPRLFVSVEREDRFPIIDILDQTPPIPPQCQWGIFLRNHDELTLEMVTDEERDYMYRAYARDPQARLNLGIRRRLAPLLQNNRRKIELMNALLLSLPGTPIIYYGDEIGMGDNIYLGDRDGVRTPMQWSPDRNAGFSQANPQRLCLPVIIDAAYHFATVNVEVQHDSPHSLLWTMRRLVHLRNRYMALGRGDFRILRPDNAKILAYLRQSGGETILIVANLSRFSQCVELDLSEFRGQTPVEVFGRTVFPPIGELPYLLTLGPHAYFWLQIGWKADEAVQFSPERLPACRVLHERSEIFTGKGKTRLESALLAFMRRDRWRPGQPDRLREVELQDVIPVEPEAADGAFWLLLLGLKYVEGGPESYLLPVVFAEEQQARAILGDHPSAGIVTIRRSEAAAEWTLCDANWEARLWQLLLAAAGRGSAMAARFGRLVLSHTSVFDRSSCAMPERDDASPTAELAKPDSFADVEVSVSVQDRRHPVAILGDQCELKIFRQVSSGTNPDYEIRRYLTEHAQSRSVPAAYVAFEYRRADTEPMTLAMLSDHASCRGDLWRLTLDELGRYAERIQERRQESQMVVEAPRGISWMALAQRDPPASAHQLFGSYLLMMSQLGQRLAALHQDLAAAGQQLKLSPVPFTELYQRSLYQSVRLHVLTGLAALAKAVTTLPDSLRMSARHILESEQMLLDRLRQNLTRKKLETLRISCHAYLHLRHVLLSGPDLLVSDFEGELGQPFAGRSIKASPLRDVAAIIRTLHHGGHAMLLGRVPGQVAPLKYDLFAPDMNFWFAWSVAAFLRAYLEGARNGRLLPVDDRDLMMLLDVHLLERAFVELQEEISLKSDLLAAPLEAIQSLIDRGLPG